MKAARAEEILNGLRDLLTQIAAEELPATSG